jgi:hypothetical protein
MSHEIFETQNTGQQLRAEWGQKKCLEDFSEEAALGNDQLDAEGNRGKH